MAQAQWQWQDKDGRTVFSDRPPPAGAEVKNIRQKLPALDKAPALLSPDAADGPAAAGSAPGGTSDLAKLRQKATEAEQAKKAAEKQRQQAARAENCNRAKQTLSALNTGQRVGRLNATGEREFLDDAQIAAEKQRTQSVIQSDCN